MPIYEYRCRKGHTLEVMQRMSDEPLTECSNCGAPVKRVFHPVAVHFKGSGFYNTDYGKKSKNAEDAKMKKDEAKKSNSDSSASKSNSDSSSKSADTKPAKASADSKSAT
jgi:putative FmdB family regulatory protein